MKIMLALFLPAAAMSSAAFAQHGHESHDGHTKGAQPASEAKSTTDKSHSHASHHQKRAKPQQEDIHVNHEAMDHRGRSHEHRGKTAMPDDRQMDQAGMEHGTGGHGTGGHGTGGHGTGGHGKAHHGHINHSAQQKGTHAEHDELSNLPVNAPPPPEAFIGPAYAADQFVGAEAMAASRAAVARAVSGTPVFWFQGDRLELRGRDGKDGYLWDIQGYYGGDLEKLWFKSEGEGSFGETLKSAEVQALYSKAIAPFFDFQLGVRQDLTGPDRTHVVVGIQGLTPYLFEIDTALFLSTKGDLTARIEGELDQRITQRLILQPRVEVNLSAQDIPELGIGGGVDSLEAGLRIRYEFFREFAPYIGVEQEWKLGGSRKFALGTGEDPSVTNFVFGIRFWF